MSEETAEIFNAMRGARQERHQEWKQANMEVLNACPYLFYVANRGESCVFRERGKPGVDFYPSTGRWRSEGKTHGGGARKFLEWYARQGTQA